MNFFCCSNLGECSGSGEVLPAGEAGTDPVGGPGGPGGYAYLSTMLDMEKRRSAELQKQLRVRTQPILVSLWAHSRRWRK